MILWLDPLYENISLRKKKFNLIYDIKENNIKFMNFRYPKEVFQFLNYLFKLKPNLNNARTGDKLRIVIEIDDEDEFRINSIKNIEIIIRYLSDVGCKIPVLIYSKKIIEKDTLLLMK